MYTSTPEFVANAEQLDAALQKLSGGDFVAVDTEFLRERTYYPKLCLVQIATDDYCALLDVLAFDNSTALSSLWDFLSDRSRTKVFHAARQDLEVLGLARGVSKNIEVEPIAGPIFDTQTAAAFMNLSGQIGYADLVEKRLHHTLLKGQTRTDWSQRPLTAEQLSYAADDVIYLVELYHNLVKELRDTERWSWITEDAKLLEDPKLYVTRPEDAWQRLRGLEQYEPTQRAAAKTLAAWREQRAIEKDLPRGWIMADDVLRKIAETLPTTVEELGNVPGVAESFVKKRGEELLEKIAASKAQAAQESDALPIFKPTRAQMKQVSALMEFVRSEAKRLRISPEILATRRDAEKLIYSGKVGSYSSGWRGDAFGKRLLTFATELTAQAL